MDPRLVRCFRFFIFKKRSNDEVINNPANPVGNDAFHSEEKPQIYS